MAWAKIGNIRGVTGHRGTTGNQGNKGSTGKTGPRGGVGANGRRGPTSTKKGPVGYPGYGLDNSRYMAKAAARNYEPTVGSRTVTTNPISGNLRVSKLVIARSVTFDAHAAVKNGYSLYISFGGSTYILGFGGFSPVVKGSRDLGRTGEAFRNIIAVGKHAYYSDPKAKHSIRQHEFDPFPSIHKARAKKFRWTDDDDEEIQTGHLATDMSDDIMVTDESDIRGIDIGVMDTYIWEAARQLNDRLKRIEELEGMTV